MKILKLILKKINFIAFGSSSTLTSFFKKYISDHTQEEKSWNYSSKYNQITPKDVQLEKSASLRSYPLKFK